MKKQTGFTLIEIMIALVLGLIVVGATISIYITTVGSSSSIIKSARLNHDLEAAMSLMINDIKRSGYWGRATSAADSRNNPFTQASTNIQTPSDTCILYSYDADSDGTVDGNEYYGFRFINNSIQIRMAGTTTTNCTDGTWGEFIDSNQLTITALNFRFVPIDVNGDGDVLDGIDLPAASRCLNVSTNTATNAASCATDTTNCTAGSPCNIAVKRLVNIQLSGQLTSDSTVTKTLSETVEIRNNRLLTQP